MYAGPAGRRKITARANTMHGTLRVLTAPLYERPGHRSRAEQQEYSKDAIRAQQQCSKGTAERSKDSQQGHCGSMVETKKTEQASVNCGEKYRCAFNRPICLDKPQKGGHNYLYNRNYHNYLPHPPHSDLSFLPHSAPTSTESCVSMMPCLEQLRL